MPDAILSGESPIGSSILIYTKRIDPDVKNCLPGSVKNSLPYSVKNCLPKDVNFSLPCNVKNSLPYDVKKVLDTCNYDQAYLSTMLPKDTPETIRDRLQKHQPSNLIGHAVGISDVIVVNRDGIITSYYIDKEQLVVLAGFIRPNSSGSLINLDTEGYRIEGKNGTWMATDEINIDGRQFFLMENEQYQSSAAFTVVDSDGKLVCDSNQGFDDTVTVQKIQEFLHPPVIIPSQEPNPPKPSLEQYQKYYENGEYLRAAEMTEEQNYNMIDGRVNNLAAPRKIGGRISVLDRLHLKQAERAIKNGKEVPKHLLSDEQERNRK
ncbi:MAG: DUF4316 domain-containing protein [Lachnospiraceae bacterium]|nr:DUF4316 domain-containing protein [Lachnospiraceae bacterium]